MNGGPKENANPEVKQIQNEISRRRTHLGWSAFQASLETAFKSGSPTDRAVLLALQDTSAVTAGKGVSLLTNVGLVIPEKETSKHRSLYIPLELGKSSEPSRPSKEEPRETTRDAIDSEEVFDIIRNIQDPEHPLTLEQLSVVSLQQVTVTEEESYSTVDVRFTPTIPHCSMATLIGLSIRVKLLRSLPGSDRLKVSVRIEPGTHNSETSVNKQLADKERVCAALENKHLLGIVNKCIAAGMNLDST